MTYTLTLHDGTAITFTDLDALKAAVAGYQPVSLSVDGGPPDTFDSLAALQAHVAAMTPPPPPDPPPHNHHLDHVLPFEEVTHQSVRSGAWSAMSTWDGGRIPDQHAKVRISPGTTVTIDGVVGPMVAWIRVEGALRWQRTGWTALTAETVGVYADATLDLGTEADPITGHAELIFEAVSGQPIDHAYDWDERSRGLLAHGLVTTYGRVKTAWRVVDGVPPAGATSLTVTEAPEGWEVGDRIVLSSDTYGQDESRLITHVTDTVVSFDGPLEHQRALPASRPDARLHVINLTRNVVIRTGAGAGVPALHGHVMLHRTADIVVGYTELRDLGRTTTAPVTDPILRADGTRDPQLMPLLGIHTENKRGRYTLHFHMCGPGAPPASLVGLSAWTSTRNLGLKQAVINHSSHVVCEDSVGWQIDGSHFFTEEGDEVGAFRRCVAIYSQGSNSYQDNSTDDGDLKSTYPEIYKTRRNDYGHRGTGFWIHSGGVICEDLIASGHAEAGISLFNETLTKPRNPRRFPQEFPSLFEVDFDSRLHWSAPGDGTKPAWVTTDGPMMNILNVPYRTRRFEAYASLPNLWNNGVRNRARRCGILVWAVGRKIALQYPTAPRNEFFDWIVWGCERAISTGYSGWATYRGRFSRNDTGISATAIGLHLDSNGGNHTNVVDSTIDGFSTPILVGQGSSCQNVTADGAPLSCGA